MDYLQYRKIYRKCRTRFKCFKPYYKWITFNILIESTDVVFIIERINFYIVAKFNHLSTS